MRTYTEHQRIRILRCLVLTSAVSFIFMVTLHKTSQMFKDYMFDSPEDLQEWPSHIQIAMVLKGLNDNDSNGFNLREKLRNFVKSVVIFTQKYPIRFVFLTDHKSVFQIEKTFQDSLPPFALENELPNGQKTDRFTRQYVNIEPILKEIEPWSKPMKKYFNHAKETFILKDNGAEFEFKTSDKYNSTIYYLSPFYHQIFPHLSKLLVLDVDMEFRVDPIELYHELDKFNMDQVVGCANDLAPHYHVMLEATGFYQLNPDSLIGQPGPLQGLNVGVLAFHLDKMRQSKKYAQHLSTKGVEKLVNTYGFYNTHLGIDIHF